VSRLLRILGWLLGMVTMPLIRMNAPRMLRVTPSFLRRLEDTAFMFRLSASEALKLTSCVIFEKAQHPMNLQRLTAFFSFSLVRWFLLWVVYRSPTRRRTWMPDRFRLSMSKGKRYQFLRP
jgi:hypothetical protein